MLIDGLVNTDEGTTSAPTAINSVEDLLDPVGKINILTTEGITHVHTETARGFFRPRRLPNNTVATLISLYPENPSLGCPYNTGKLKSSSGKLDKKACSIFGDIVQIAPARMIAQNLAKDGVSVYKYRFNHLPYGPANLATKGIGTGVEQAYVFSNLKTNLPWDTNLAYQMSASWASFAHDLDPSSGTGRKFL